MRKTPIQQFFDEELSEIERIIGRLHKAGAPPKIRVAPCDYALRFAVEERKKLFQKGKWYVSRRTLFGDIDVLTSLVDKAGFEINQTFSDDWSHIVIFSEKGAENAG
jgi:hypothetical protein